MQPTRVISGLIVYIGVITTLIIMMLNQTHQHRPISPLALVLTSVTFMVVGMIGLLLAGIPRYKATPKPPTKPWPPLDSLSYEVEQLEQFRARYARPEPPAN